MFATTALPLAKEFHVVVTVVALRVPASIQSESATSAAADIECIVNKQHPHGFAHGDTQDLLLGNLAILNRDARDGLFPLAAQQQTSFGIFGHTNPRTVRVGVGGQNMFNRKAGKRIQNFGGVFQADGL